MNSDSPSSCGVPGTGFAVSTADHAWLALACQLAEQCPPSQTAFSVGSIVVATDGKELGRGYSRQGGDAHVHAEEAALAPLPSDGDPRIAQATIYSSLEPCAKRASRPMPCAHLIRAAGIRRVVTAWLEPDTFVPGANGTELLEAAGTVVIELSEHASAAQAPNRHLLV